MKKTYSMNKSKENVRLEARNNQMEAEHKAKNEFVKRQQMEMAKYAGKNPRMEARYMQYDSCMTNEGMKAEEFGRELTKGLDKKAFPVK